MMIFADAQQTRGNITHFIGHYYFGMGTVGGRIPTEEGWMIDNTGGWIIQLAKDYEQTGDMEYLRRYAGRVYNGMEFLRSLMPEGLEIPIGGTTYDDFHHPPVYSYGADDLPRHAQGRPRGRRGHGRRSARQDLRGAVRTDAERADPDVVERPLLRLRLREGRLRAAATTCFSPDSSADSS